VSRDWTEQSAATCGVGREGIQRAVIAWAVPLTAVALLVLGLRDSLLKVFNILVVAFGTTALVRSVAHIRRFGSRGLGGHVAIGAILNVAIVVLVIIYIFTAFDPLALRRP
jgi:hypothetical protein